MNPYKLPKSLKVRFHIVDMVDNIWYKKHRYNVTMDTIFIAMAMDNLIPCDKECLAYIVKQKDSWLQRHRSECKCIHYMVSYGRRGKCFSCYCC